MMLRRLFPGALFAVGLLTTTAVADEPRPALKAGEVEFSLGKGVFARVTPPAGWSSGSADVNERCWNAPRAEGRFCVSTTWTQGRDNKAILKDYLSGLTCETRDEKTATDGPVRSVRRDCIVKIGPRKEGRIWSVSTVDGARDALRLAVDLQREDKAFLDVLAKALDSVSFMVPKAGDAETP